VAFEYVRPTLWPVAYAIRNGLRLAGFLIGTVISGRESRTELQRANWRLGRTTLKLERAKVRLRDVQASRRRTRARRLSEHVLTQVMSLRHRALVATDATLRQRREVAFLDRARSYREARASSDAPVDVIQVERASLTWWIPRSDASEANRLILGKQRLPFKEILDSRELAVGGIMLDIGANIGTTSIPRVVLGDFECVYAAEPDAANYHCLVRNIVHNQLQGLVLPDRVAIGDRAGTMMLARRNTGTHHLAETFNDQDDVVSVECTTLDAWVTTLGIDVHRVTFVKADTQGWEIRALLGAEDLLRHKQITWQLEFSPSMLMRAGCDPARAYDVMRAHFTHFIDMRGESGTRVRRTSELAEALRYVERGERRYTNLLLYNAGS
jgi:FkbM family methyltransferase